MNGKNILLLRTTSINFSFMYDFFFFVAAEKFVAFPCCVRKNYFSFALKCVFSSFMDFFMISSFCLCEMRRKLCSRSFSRLFRSIANTERRRRKCFNYWHRELSRLHHKFIVMLCRAHDQSLRNDFHRHLVAEKKRKMNAREREKNVSVQDEAAL